MLKELYDYALENDLILPAGFIKKKVHAYVLLAKDGKFLGVLPGQVGASATCWRKNAAYSFQVKTRRRRRTFERPWRRPQRQSLDWRFV